MRQRDVAVAETRHHRLRVVERRRAGGAVPRVADRDGADDDWRPRRTRPTRGPSCARCARRRRRPTAHDPGRLLAAMLEGIQPEVRQRGCALMAPDSEDTAHELTPQGTGFRLQAQELMPRACVRRLIGCDRHFRHHGRHGAVIRRANASAPPPGTGAFRSSTTEQVAHLTDPPISAAGTPCRLAIASTAAGSGVETITRPCASPKSSARSDSSDHALRSTNAPRADSSCITQHSASATASPPSLQSCAEATVPSADSLRAAPR